MSSYGEPQLLVAEGITKTFVTAPGWRTRRNTIEAVRDANLVIEAGASVGLVGESGSGKTTLARILIGLEHPDAGRILMAGQEASAAKTRRHAREVQMVFQDPYTSLDPRQTALQMLDETQRVHFKRPAPERRARSLSVLESVGISEREGGVLPTALSGGQRQRVAIARALATEPRVLILDEAVSALDVSVQAQILNLLTELRQTLHLTYLIISHDLAVIRQMADTVSVMYRGRIVEAGPTDAVLDAPMHPYTRELRAAVPEAGKPVRTRVARLPLETGGCVFRHRCELVGTDCLSEPSLFAVDPTHHVRCWRVITSSHEHEQAVPTIQYPKELA